MSSSKGSAKIYFLPLDSFGWVVPLVTGHEYKIEWKDAGYSARTMNFTFGVRQYLTESMRNDVDESVMIDFSPYSYDYTPYTFKVVYGNRKAYASTNNNTLSLQTSKIAASQYSNHTLKTILSTVGANLTNPAVRFY